MYLRSTVKSQEAKDEDESTESSQRNRVTGHLQRLPSLVEPGDHHNHQWHYHQSHHIINIVLTFPPNL